MDEFGFDGFDLGGYEDLGSFDLGGLDLGGLDAGSLDLGGLDFGSLADLGSFEDIAAVDALQDLGFGGFDLGSFEDLAAVDALQDLGFGGFDLGGYDSLPELTRSLYGEEGAITPKRVNVNDPGSYRVPQPVDRLNYGFGGDDLGGFADLEEASRQARLAEYGVQDLGPTMSPTDEQGRLQLSGYDEDRLPSQWQKVGDSDLRVMIQDDGSGIGINPVTGTHFGLEREQVQNLVKQGLLNTYKSGYFGATGGSKVAPGGGITTTTKDGKEVVLKPDGKVYDTNTGKTITDTKIIKEVIETIRNTGGTGNVSTRPGQQQNMLSSLLPLLMMMLAMNRGGGSSGQGSSAVIPALTATQKQTPYTQIQQAPGYRPGQGGITYFNPTQYAPRMAGGGIIDLARALAAKRREQRQGLLKGRGDGVSDSIPAMIGRDQPARLARGEYVVDARTVAELGNGSTDAGAERLDEMRKRVHAKRKKAKVGEDSKARKALPV